MLHTGLPLGLATRACGTFGGDKKGAPHSGQKSIGHNYYAANCIITCMNSGRNFETNMFRFGTASSIVVCSLATWSAFSCQRNVIAIFRVVNLWHSSVSSVHNHGGLSFLHTLWYILIENFD